MSQREEVSDQVPILLPNGEEAWVSPGAFNLISEQQFQDSKRLQRLRAQRNLALVIAAVALLVFTVDGLAFLVRLQLAHAPETLVLTTESSPEEARVPTTPPSKTSAPTPSPSSPEQAAAPKVSREIPAIVNAWADAWAAQDVERYLGFYSVDFRPPDDLERPVWESLRRQRIERPASVEIMVGDIEATRFDERSAIARFTQRYRSPGYQDWVLKTLELALEKDRWKIVSESSSMIERSSAPTQTLAAVSAGSAGQ